MTRPSHTKKKYIIWLLPLLLLLKSLPSLGLDYKFTYISTEQGLPQNTIKCITKDSYGYMWFGTDNGLCRYDGYNIKVFSEKNDSTGLPDMMILDLQEDKQKNLWIATKKGIAVFNLEKEIFLDTRDILDISVKNIQINDILFDKDNQLWLATTHRGIFQYKKNKDAYQLKRQFYNQNISTNTTNVLFATSTKQILAGTASGVLTYDKLQNNFIKWPTESNHILNLHVNDIYETDDYSIWIGTANGLFQYTNLHNMPLWLNTETPNNLNVSHNNTTSLAQDSYGNLIIGTLGGLNIYSPITNTISHLGAERPDNFKLANPFISCIFSDNQGNIWIGNEKGGINRYNIFQKEFKIIFHDPKTNNNLNNNVVNSIYKNKNDLWIGTAGGGINHLNLNTDKYTFFTHDPDNNNSINSNFITSISENSAGELFFGTWGMGLNKLSSKRAKKFKHYLRDDNNLQNSLGNNFISSIYQDERGFLLIGTEGGLSIFNPKQEVFINFGNEPGRTNPINEVGCILKSQDNHYWIGTRNGLHRFSTDKINPPFSISLPEKDIQLFQEDPNNTNSLPGNYIISLSEDKEGNIWIGTYGYGLSKCTRLINGKFKFTNYQFEHGLTNNVIYSILEDKENKLWLSTDNGLYSFDKEKETFEHYTTSDGLLSNQFYWSAGYKTDAGELYFGSVNGINHFKPSDLKNYPHIPKAEVIKLKVFNKEVRPYEAINGRVILKKSLLECDTITLSHKDNIFSLEFSALSYFLPEKLRYAYQLEGVDKDWVTTKSTQRTASYTNLKGDTYKFKIKAYYENNPEAVAITEKTIIIKPPFWQENWFKLLLVAAIVLLIITYTRYRSFQLNQQKKSLEKKVTERTRQIEKQKQLLETQAAKLQDSNHTLEKRQSQIEQQKLQLEKQNSEILEQRDQLLDLNKEIESINKMRLQFFTNISHEFRTPLTLILSPIESLLKQKLPQETQNTIKLINRNAERLLHLINQILTFRKLEAGKIDINLVEENIIDFITEIKESFDPLAETQKITYDLICEKPDFIVFFDKNKLENILYNLISNAFKYTTNGETIKIIVQEGLSKNQHKTIKITISDTGQGISEEQKSFIFDRFYRATSSGNTQNLGTGIGLSLTHELISLQNGSIEVESEENKGSQFIFELPIEPKDYPFHKIAPKSNFDIEIFKNKVELITQQLSVPESEQNEASPINTNKATLLIVEDNNDLRAFLANSLSNSFNILEAENGKIGCEIGKKHNPDLIISDVMMPEMDGMEMCSQLKNNIYTSHIPIILLTAKGMEENIISGLSIGADDYIPKPFNLNILQARVNNLIDSRTKLRHLFSTQASVTPTEITHTSVDEEFMLKINEILEENYTNPDFDVEKFSTAMYVSRSLLYKKLKALCDLSPNDFISIYRLKKAAPLLKTKNYPINEIAYMIGFNDPKYFSRVFKKFYKKSPSEYAK